MAKIRIPPAILLTAAGVGQHVLARDHWSARRARTALAATVATASAGLLGATIWRFRRGRTTVDPVSPEKTSTLITDGPNAFTRNPMYLGMAGLLLAHSIYRGSGVSLIPAAGFVFVIDRFQISLEEQALREMFGTEFIQYCDLTPRWLGFKPFPGQADPQSGPSD